MNGLNINMEEFKRLPQKQQLALVFENTEVLKSMVSSYKFNQKIQYTWLFVLTIGLGLSKFLIIS